MFKKRIIFTSLLLVYAFLISHFYPQGIEWQQSLDTAVQTVALLGIGLGIGLGMFYGVLIGSMSGVATGTLLGAIGGMMFTSSPGTGAAFGNAFMLCYFSLVFLGLLIRETKKSWLPQPVIETAAPEPE